MKQQSFLSDNPKLQELLKLDQEMMDLAGAMGVLHWDQEVYMPERGIALRPKQLSTLAGILHEKQTNPRIGELLGELEEDIKKNSDRFAKYDRAYLRQMRRDFDQATKLPKKLVQALSEATSCGTQSWEKAKEEDNFTLFEPDLKLIFELVLEKAEHLGYEESAYDALLDEYEIGSTASWLEKILVPLREETKKLLDKIQGSEVKLSQKILFGDFDLEKQEQFAQEVINWFGYQLEAGRKDLSTHPFTIGFGGPQDVRITTRVKREQINYAFMPTIHETGHAVYEQNINSLFTRSRLSGGITLGVHESQSRFFENIVGRSLSFWRFWYPQLQKLFFGQLPHDGLMEFYRAINMVKPTLIRTEADEITYNLHIILRFETEKDLFDQKIQISDLPEIWREKMKEYLGLVPKTHKEGVLQDIHWSHGYFGYFPTYTLGNLYAAQFTHKMREDLDLDGLLEKGEFEPIREWLKEGIHQWGKTYLPNQLAQRITGEELNPKHFTDYLNEKFNEIYRF